jgi:cobalt/nickel transport system permease protein
MRDLLRLHARTAPAWFLESDPRVRIVTALVFALAVLNLENIPSLALALIIPATLALALGMVGRRLLKRLVALEGFMLVLLLMLPFSVPGEAWFSLGDLTATRAGAERALVILLKANTVVIAMLCLVGTMEPVVLGHALGRLRVPDKLIHLFLFTVRYLGDLFLEYQRLRQAMRTRCFTPATNAHSWRALGWLVGMLLVRSLDRSQRITDAMKCRGFQGRFYLIDDQRWQRPDTLWGLTLLLVVAVLLGIDRMV